MVGYGNIVVKIKIKIRVKGKIKMQDMKFSEMEKQPPKSQPEHLEYRFTF